MRILLINTAGAEGSVALADTARAPEIVGSEALPGRSSSERLVPAVRKLLEAQGWRLGELAAIVVVHGPGSFTGVRVGVSAAKGLVEAGGMPLLAVSRLALLADAAQGEERVHAVLDAGRGEFYYGEYVRRRCVREELLSAETVMEATAGGLVVVCEAGVADALAGLGPQVVAEPLAEDALRIAVERIRIGDFDDAAAVDANYLRQTDLEIFAKAAAQKAAR